MVIVTVCGQLSVGSGHQLFNGGKSILRIRVKHLVITPHGLQYIVVGVINPIIVVAGSQDLIGILLWANFHQYRFGLITDNQEVGIAIAEQCLLICQHIGN